jgi:hypothetical protein
MIGCQEDQAVAAIARLRPIVSHKGEHGLKRHPSFIA